MLTIFNQRISLQIIKCHSVMIKWLKADHSPVIFLKIKPSEAPKCHQGILPNAWLM